MADTLTDYTPEQLGEFRVAPITAHTLARYSLVVLQPRSGRAVTLMEPCTWEAGRARTHALVRAGVDPAHIRARFRRPHQRDTRDLPLLDCHEPLWWTNYDQSRIEMEREREQRIAAAR